MRPRLNHPTVVAYLALFVALGGGALAASNGFVDSNGQLHACVSKKGKIKLVKSAGKKCPKKNTKVAWNQTGPAGTRGLQGVPGKTGAQGPGARSFNLGFSDTSYKTIATVSGVDVEVRCGANVNLKLAPHSSSDFIYEAGFASLGSGSPSRVDDSSSEAGYADPSDFVISLNVRANSAAKWTHLELVASRDGGDNTCKLGGLITPPS